MMFCGTQLNSPYKAYNSQLLWRNSNTITITVYHNLRNVQITIQSILHWVWDVKMIWQQTSFYPTTRQSQTWTCFGQMQLSFFSYCGGLLELKPNTKYLAAAM